MPPKAKDAKGQKGQYKQGTALKDIIPPTIKQPAREGRPVRISEYAPTNAVFNPYEPQPEFEEWPGDEAAVNFDFGLDAQGGKTYVDPVKFAVPPSFKSKENHMIFWRRPKEIIKTEAYEAHVSFSNYVGSDSQLGKKKALGEGEPNFGRNSIYLGDESGTTPLHQDDVELTMFETFDREETQEEVDARIKEIMERQQQAKKKPAKKDEAIDTNPQKIKDVKLSNISMKDEIPAYSKWIASQLQIIKDRNIRDVHTKKPIWTKVYPQKDGVPVVNPSGRYWVKLYHMGKEKKIDIDDKIPVIYNKSLFPRSVNNNEIWPYIITKALIKLNSVRWNDETAKEVEVGDGSIVYALTGYVPETINLGLNFQDKWKNVAEALSDKKYSSGDQYITCFCMPSHRPSAPSNKAKNSKELALDTKQLAPAKSSSKKESPRSQSESRNSLQRASNENVDAKSPKVESPGPIKRKDQPSMTTLIRPKPEPLVNRPEDSGREKPTYVIPGFAYSVVDLFENESLNMVYVLKRTENDLKLRTDYMNLQKVNLNKMTKEEKLEHRRAKKELKEKIYEEDTKRMELIKKPAIHYKLLKVKSSVGKVPGLNFICPFDEEDIHLAKKCILNKLSKPPNYDLYDLRMDDKSVSSAQVTTHATEQKLLPLDDFSRIENAKEPLKKGSGGSWMTNRDFEGCFQYIQVFHDPTKFRYKDTFSALARQDEELVNYEDKEVIVVEGNTDEEEKDHSKEAIGGLQPFLYSFTSSRAPNIAVEPKPSFLLQKYDFKNFEVAHTHKTLNQVHDSDRLLIENKNQIFRIQLISPLSTYFWISSNLHFKLTSVADFLCTYEGYQLKNQQIEYPILEKSRYHLYYKGILHPLSQRERIICRLRNANDLVMLRSLRLKLIELTHKAYRSEEDFKTGVVTFPLEETFYNIKSVPIIIEPEKRYMIVIEGLMQDTVNEGILDFDILYKSPEFGIDQVEQVEPLEYMDKYNPTKYGILFRERLFLNNEAQVSFFVRISEVLAAANQQATQKGKKGEVPQVEEKEITERRSIKLELLRDDELVSFAFGQNKVILSNTTLYPTNNKDETRNYYLQATFDLREWPEGKEDNEQTNNIHWILKICSNDTIGVIRDTQKEDNIKAIKKSWEDKEPGRAEKAKTARKKHTIMEKMKRGEPLDQDEITLMNEPRQKKNKEEEAKKDPKGKPQPKAKAPPAKGPGKKEEAPVEEKKEERPLPKAENHVMEEISKFLTHMEQPRLLEEGDADDEPTVRTKEERNELREKILLGKEEVYGMFDRNKRAKDKIKDILTENREKVAKDLQTMRENMKEKLTNLMKDREEFRKKDKEVKDKERAVIALCKQEKPNYEEVVKALNENTESGQVDPALLKTLAKVKKNAYITDKIERMNTALTAYDIPALTAVLEEVKNEAIEVDPELIEKAEELIDTAEKNPNFIADKQKEAQKAMKGKKK